MIHLDTHVVVWLYEGRTERLSTIARDLLRAARPLVSPMVRLELAFLHELGRVTVPAGAVLDALRVDADLGPAESDLERATLYATTLTWTRDPFDRMIVGHALADDLPLVTCDERILRHCPLARW